MRYIEKKIVRKVVKALTQADKPVVSVRYGPGEEVPAGTIAETVDAVFAVDECYLMTDDGWVFIVLGNGWDVISDYTLHLEDALAPVEEWIRRNET